ncbi:MAG: integration host factor subunit alpha [Candidatus Puniceispirillum sp.]|nr:integration host factor subunit alpha [Candidatus Puniceispirillum sp.]
MSEKTLTRAEISDCIASRLNLSRRRAMELLEETLEEMSMGLEREGQLKLSSFGSFSIRKKKNRVGRNPKTGQEVMIEPRQVISFRASLSLKELVE